MKKTTGKDLQSNPLCGDDPLTRLPGIGPKTAAVMAENGYRCIRELLLHLPKRYENRAALVTLDSDPVAGTAILVRGRVLNPKVRRIPRRRLTIVDGVITDGFGEMAVVWFNQPWIGNRLQAEEEFYFSGKVRETRGGTLQLLNPEVDEVAEENQIIVPVYPAIGRFGARRMRRLIEICLPVLDSCSDPLPAGLRARFNLPEIDRCLRHLHRPRAGNDPDETEAITLELNQSDNRYRRRLAFDELLAFACAIAERRGNRIRLDSPKIDRQAVVAGRAGIRLPFDLTAAQKRVVSDIERDMTGATPMARLLQGDVGSGKTAVAALATAMATAAGHQVAILAPTEILAEQHERTLGKYLGENGSAPCLLTGSQPAAERRRVHRGLRDGSISTVVGTHALFQENVSYRNLGLVIVDEQHRFGVLQRSALTAKGRCPHLLVMTATPIPRSLALTVYGDLELSIIDQLPPGRHPVRTVVRSGDARKKVYEFLRREIAEGGRAFVVFPVIDVNEENSVAALAGHEEEVRNWVPEAAIGVVHGRLSRDAREAVTEGFRRGSIQVLLATTVVEVGVDVPEASVMAIESADRFGLSQLHQLRGRVGRGTRKSWCILLTGPKLGEPARRRLEIMCRSGDGFEIAEADLEARGPGELIGTRQWGPAGFRFADLIRDMGLIEATRRVARELEQEGSLARVRDALARYHPIDSLEIDS